MKERDPPRPPPPNKKSLWAKWKFWLSAGSAEAAAAAAAGLVIGATDETASPGLKGWGITGHYSGTRFSR